LKGKDMCEACLADMVCYKKKLFGEWFLLRARKDWDYIKLGDFGITRCNGPKILFNVVPWCDPDFGLTVEQLDEASEEHDKLADKWLDDACIFADQFQLNADLVAVAELAIDAYKDGYDPKGEVGFIFYLFHKLGELIQEETHSD
jgi:hypothetical protein